MTEHITARQFHADPSLAEWRVIGDGACTFFRTRSFVESARLIQAISELPGLEGHTPDVDLRQDGVTVRLITITDDYYGMSQLHIALADPVVVLGDRDQAHGHTVLPEIHVGGVILEARQLADRLD